ncbi:hypothetical protein ICN10_00120 [Polynucleobacter sp. 86C-FISCH]|uniref:hypothetical protein n=1 Tax=Polynucleobacter sp. 86C-FISCH TaxID=2689101 RepID=UPI001C0DC12E|nr:hypothetical protein [Polynucleobacter sp. 86C-FISCH]MBU3594804.1 hypothetical protein [Polynucleobacter sp. 86C-FISCH]
MQKDLGIEMLKRIFAITFLMVSSSSIYAQTQLDKQFSDERAAVFQAVKDKRINNLDARKELLSLSKTFFPSDELLIAHDEYGVEIATRLQNKEITLAQFNELMAERNERFKKAQEIRKANDQAQARAKQDQIDAYNQAVQQQRNAVAGAIALQGIGNAFSNSFGQSITPPMQICNYYGNTRYCQ